LAEVSLVDAKNWYVRAEAGKMVALIGVEDLVVVDTKDALLIMPRARAQEVKRVVEDLGRRESERHL
jgi:mannose-1-phosphate guanylyltransferase